MNPYDLINVFKSFDENNKSLFINLFVQTASTTELDKMINLLNIRLSSFNENFSLYKTNNFDIITLLESKGLYNLTETIFSRLNDMDLMRCQFVSKQWQKNIINGNCWKNIILRKLKYDSLWRNHSEIRGWIKLINRPLATMNKEYFYNLFIKVTKDINQLQHNWSSGNHTIHKIVCHSENIKGVYSLQYDNDKIISGLRDNTIKIWDKQNLTCRSILHGHSGSVLCLQYDDKVIITGSSDSTVKIWDIKTGELLNTLFHHTEAVLHLRFDNYTLVTCSKDRFTFVFNFNSPQTVNLKQTLVGHRAAVNVVDFDQIYIITASGDRTIKIWNTENCNYIRTLSGHKRGIACLQYRYPLVISGSSDSHIRLWHVEEGTCLQILEGHDELVRCIRFDNNRIISGAYDGRIKVWNLKLKSDHTLQEKSHCSLTLQEHTGRVFRLQFDDFQIISSSHDDTILIWNFLPIVSQSYWDP